MNRMDAAEGTRDGHDSKGLSVERAIDELKQFRRGRTLGGTTLRELIDDGRSERLIDRGGVPR